MSIEATDLVTAEGLKQAFGSGLVERRVMLYENPNATGANNSITLTQSVNEFQLFEVSLISDDGCCSTAIIPRKNSTLVIIFVNGATAARVKVAMSGTKMETFQGSSHANVGFLRVVGIV